MTSQTDHIGVELKGHVLVITLNRPGRYNALTPDMLDALGKAFEEAGRNPDVRVVVFFAEGKAFCAGADVSSLAVSADSDVDRQLAIDMPRFTARQVGIYKPTICAVNGICAGAGLHFVCDSEIVIASESASFTDTHVNVGQVTALEPIGLSRRIPLGAVLRMVVLGKEERLTAEAALQLGLVSEVVPPDKLRSRAFELADIIAEVSPAAVQTSLRAIWESMELPLSEAYDKGYELLVRHRSHPDALEGPQAFSEKRKPEWSILPPGETQEHEG